jgi:hypothetical protein
MYKFLFLFIFTLISGCAVRQQENNSLAELLHTQTPQQVLQQLQESEPADRDLLQFHLNVGFLQFVTGDFRNAITTLSLAKQEMAELQATSISENIEAGTLSELLRSYSGYPTDRVMVHNILALSYLFNNEIYEARVEILQAELAMKKLLEKDDINGQLASVYLLSGVVYELLDELSNALISYKDAAEIMNKRGITLPLGLKQALLRVSLNLGAKEQYEAYQAQFPELSLPDLNNSNQVFVFYFDGVVSHKIQNSLIVPAHNLDRLIRISMPAYPPLNKLIGYAKIIQEKSQLLSELVDDVEVLVREDLAKEYPSILLLTTTRAVAKYQLVKNVQKQDPLVGFLVNIGTVLTEEADLRSWNMLPANIQFAYLEPVENELLIDNGSNSLKTIAIAGGTKHVLLINSLSKQIFHYQQH